MSFLTGLFKSSNKQEKKMRLHYYVQRFQIREALWLALIGMFCFAIMTFLLYLALFRAADSARDPVLARELVAQTFETKRILMYFEVSIPLFVFTAFLFSIGVVASHRTAGPIFAIKRHINRVRNGLLRREVALRRNDQLQDVAAALNAMLVDFWGREDGAKERLALALTALEQGDYSTCRQVLEKARAELSLANPTVVEKDITKKAA